MDTMEFGKKEGSGIHWLFLYLWNTIISALPSKGQRFERNRVAVGLALYLLVLHMVFIRVWSRCSTSSGGNA